MPRRAVLAVLAVAASLSFAAPASACTGAFCDAVNEVCTLARGEACVK